MGSAEARRDSEVHRVAFSRLIERRSHACRQARRYTRSLPEPLPVSETAIFWRERILAESDELKLARLGLQKAQATARRVRAGKTPDPTFGSYTASEIGGRERIFGVSISIPFPGSARDLHSARAFADVEVLRQEAELKRRQLETEIAGALANARCAYDSLQIANEGAAAMQDNANLMQRAYVLGEAELQALLMGRRQATAATKSALQAQTTALKSYYGLLVDAHLIWDLSHE